MIIVLVKKTLKRTWTSQSSLSALRTIKALKKFGKKEKMRGIKRKIVEFAAFMPQSIKNLFQWLRLMPLRVYQRSARIG